MLSSLLASLWQDLRVGARNLLASPRFALVASLTLALGVGVNGAAFSIVNGTMINVVPWQADGVVSIESQKLAEKLVTPVSGARYLDWLKQSESFRHLLAVRFRPFVLTDREPSEAVAGVEVSAEAFAALGLQVARGRGFVPADALPDAPPQVVLTHALWSERFGGADLVGRTIEIEDQAVSVVGVLAEDHWFPTPDMQILAPLRPRTLAGPRDRSIFGVLGVLKPDVTLERARLELDTISLRLAAQYPDTDSGWSARVRNVRELFAGGGNRAALLLLVGAVGAVLLVACINVANLLLARGIARQKELAIRCSVGASRGRIVIQLLVESLTLALLAFPLSLLFARGTIDIMMSRRPPNVSWLDQVFRFDAQVWLFMSVLTLGTVLLFGLLPALRTSRLDLNAIIKEGGDRGSSGPGGGWLRASLTVAQLSAALALVVVATLCIQSFNAVMSDDIGFDFDRLFITSIRLPETRYADPPQWNTFQEQLAARLEQLEGVSAAGVTDASPVASGGLPTIPIAIAGAHASKPDAKIEVRISAVSPGYLEATGLRLQLGRTFTAEDDARSTPVALVNQAMVRTYFDGESPLGDRISTKDGERQIVGVLQDIKRFGLRDGKPVPEVFVPFAQQPSFALNVVARTSGDPLALGPSVRSELDAVDPLLPIFQLTSVRKLLQDNLWPTRIFADLMLLLAVLTVSLAAVGVYGVVGYSVAQRMQEFAIRSALGAEPQQIVRLVLRGALWIAGAGIALGLLLSLLATAGLRAGRILSRNVDTSDPTVFLGASLLLGAIMLGASAIPAYRSTRAEPSQAMRAQ